MIRTVVVLFSAALVLWGVPPNTNAEDTNLAGQMLSTPSTATLLEEPLPTFRPPEYLNEWHVVAKIPSSKGLAIGVFWFQEGMSRMHICSKFGDPQDTILLYLEGYYHGSILLYPNHYFLLSSSGTLQNIIERP